MITIPAKSIYGIKRYICGVYKITNKLTGDFYIGSSVDVGSRLSLHFGRDAKRYPNHPLYRDINTYGRDNFNFELIEVCDREHKIERELYYYNLLNPTYNQIEPCENNFLDEEVRKRSIIACQTDEFCNFKKEQFSSEHYFNLFKENARWKMRPVNMIKNDIVIMSFESLQSASRWISDNTKYKGKNKTSKIKAVCDGERLTAYGYKWEYKEV